MVLGEQQLSEQYVRIYKMFEFILIALEKLKNNLNRN
jgi:hypothetical protein